VTPDLKKQFCVTGRLIPLA